MLRLPQPIELSLFYSTLDHSALLYTAMLHARALLSASRKRRPPPCDTHSLSTLTPDFGPCPRRGSGLSKVNGRARAYFTLARLLSLHISFSMDILIMYCTRLYVCLYSTNVCIEASEMSDVDEQAQRTPTL